MHLASSTKRGIDDGGWSCYTQPKAQRHGPGLRRCSTIRKCPASCRPGSNLGPRGPMIPTGTRALALLHC
eukprot:11917158-Heterocapsa_arctica.AAC.1